MTGSVCALYHHIYSPCLLNPHFSHTQWQLHSLFRNCSGGGRQKKNKIKVIVREFFVGVLQLSPLSSPCALG